MATKTKIKKFASLSELFARADGGEGAAQKCVIGTLNNFGCDHLAQGHRHAKAKWHCYWYGLQQYLDSLIGEYGIPETKAEREVLAEVNASRTYSDDVKLTEE